MTLRQSGVVYVSHYVRPLVMEHQFHDIFVVLSFQIFGWGQYCNIFGFVVYQSPPLAHCYRSGEDPGGKIFLIKRFVSAQY